MRLTKEQAAENRKKIVETAAKLFRERGMEGVGLNDLMSEAGFTHGGFYNHFASKEELAAEAIAQAFGESLANLKAGLGDAEDPDALFAKSVDDYFSASHRDCLTSACPTAAMSTDASRHGKDVQEAFATGIENYLAVMIARMDGDDEKEKRARAMTILSTMVGAMVLSRAVKLARPNLSTKLLDSARSLLPKELGASKKKKKKKSRR